MLRDRFCCKTSQGILIHAFSRFGGGVKRSLLLDFQAHICAYIAISPCARNTPGVASPVALCATDAEPPINALLPTPWIQLAQEESEKKNTPAISFFSSYFHIFKNIVDTAGCVLFTSKMSVG